MRNKGNEEADRRGRERRLLETKKRTDGNKKADRCGLESGPLKTGGGIGGWGEGQLVGDDDCHQLQVGFVVLPYSTFATLPYSPLSFRLIYQQQPSCHQRYRYR